jgi:cytochrome P450
MSLDEVSSFPPLYIYYDVLTHFWIGNDIYDRPNDFIPERWSSKPGLIKQDKAFAPFSVGTHTPPPHIPSLQKRSKGKKEKKLTRLDFVVTGPFSCVGRPLAMMNLRMTLAQLVYTYDISLPASMTMDEARTAMEGNMKDNFTLMPGQLSLVFKRRV